MTIDHLTAPHQPPTRARRLDDARRAVWRCLAAILWRASRVAERVGSAVSVHLADRAMDCAGRVERLARAERDRALAQEWRALATPESRS